MQTEESGDQTKKLIHMLQQFTWDLVITVIRNIVNSHQANKHEKKVQQTKEPVYEPVYADLGHPDEEFVMDIFRDDTALHVWNAEH